MIRILIYGKKFDILSAYSDVRLKMTIARTLFWCLALNTNFWYVEAQKNDRINASVLGMELQKLSAAAGWKFIQEKYRMLSYQEVKADGRTVTEKIAKSIGQRLDGINAALQSLKKTVDESFPQMTSLNPPANCCSTDRNYKFDAHFKSDVSTAEICASHPSYVKADSIKYPTNAVLQTMINNHKSSGIVHYQYIGFKTGLFVTHPATKLAECESYDPRLRPYFVSSTSYRQRDLVIVLDVSTSMRGEKLNKAKHAIITVMDTLSYRDRIGIVVFDSAAHTPENCYRRKLVPVTSTTKQYLNRFVSSADTGKGSDYAAGLRAAFCYFERNSGSGNAMREQIILFISDGDNTGDDPLEVIRDENHRLKNQVLINTYGIGTGLSSKDEQLLLNISNQVLNNETYGDIKIGKREILMDLEKTPLQEVLGMYYDYSSIPISQTPTYTLPYKDFISKEFVLSGCLPIGYMGAFVGVVCADILLEELVSDITYLQHGEHSYAFIIDDEERTLVHPLLPDPRDVKANNYDVNNIYNFEISGDFDKVVSSMKRGESGHRLLNTTVIKSRGDPLRDGDSSSTMEAIYHWTPIISRGINLSLCVVMKKNNVIRTLNKIPPQRGDFLYHRWDLTKWPEPVCKHHNRYATEERTTVNFSPDAKLRGYDHNHGIETEKKVYHYENYIAGTIQTNPGLKPSVINSLRATSIIERFWKKPSHYDSSLIWRYIMTDDGVQRIYPGARLPDEYDHKLRSWYRKTVAMRELTVVSGPYEDSGGAGSVITLSRAILIGRKGGEKIEAVVGADVSLYFFHQLLLDIYPICRNKTEYSCIIVDDSGSLVMHPYLTETALLRVRNPIHITNKEFLIARSLTSEGILYRQPCRNTENKKEQITFRVKLPRSKARGMLNDVDGYEIRPVSGTNLFLILKRRQEKNEYPCCKDPQIQPNQLECPSMECLCLCYSRLRFNDCKNKYQNTDTVTPCSREVPMGKHFPKSELDKVANLNRCFQSKCHCRKTEEECFRASGCSWCKYTADGAVVKGFCDFSETCPFQQCVTAECESKCEFKKRTESTPTSIKVIVPLCSVLIIIAAVSIVIVIRNVQRKSNDTYIEAVHREENEMRNSTSTYQELTAVADLTEHSNDRRFTAPTETYLHSTKSRGNDGSGFCQVNH